jgi:hypothetical protein
VKSEATQVIQTDAHHSPEHLGVPARWWCCRMTLRRRRPICWRWWRQACQKLDARVSMAIRARLTVYPTQVSQTPLAMSVQAASGQTNVPVLRRVYW